MQAGASSNIGEIHYELSQPNQDNFLINDEKHIYAVFDGHGDQGHNISSYLKHNLASTFMDSLNHVKSVEESLRHTFHTLDDNICKSTQSESSGSTCAVAYIAENMLYVAGVGDCSAVLVEAAPSNGKIKTTTLLPVHKLSNVSEFDRILQTGANTAGEYIVCRSDPNKVINMTRAFGDQDMKSAGIIAIPEISTTTLSPLLKDGANSSNRNLVCDIEGSDGNQRAQNTISNDKVVNNGNHNNGDSSHNADHSDDQNNDYNFQNIAQHSSTSTSDTNINMTAANNTQPHTEDQCKNYDTFLILCSDGLEQIDSFDEVARQAHKLLKEQLPTSKESMHAMCSKLIQQLEDCLYDRDGVGFNDDTTIVIVLLHGFSSHV